MEAVKIGIAGLGTVGGGTYAVLKRNAQELSRRAGAPIEVKTVVCRNIDRARGIVDERVTLSKDWHDLVNDPEIDIVVEVMGGIEPAKSLVLEAIAAGKHVVTANKALLALHGNEIFTAAAEKGVAVSYEAAVAGGIPVIKSLREGLAANRIEWIAGIINGTCNFILSTMRDKGLSFEEALAQAASALADARAEAAPRFAEAVTAQMDRLEMGGAQLVCDLAPLERVQWTKAGPQAVEFLFRPGAGMQARPLARIASGGEVSRVMLAVKVVLGEVDDVDTLVFDEVDAGVGGSTAVALADVLADLARTHQVIVVTHLAQVAVRGQAHYVVRKAAGDEGAMPETDLRQLPESERPAEIARMLSGDATETSLAHAREMLARAAG